MCYGTSPRGSGALSKTIGREKLPLPPSILVLLFWFFLKPLLMSSLSGRTALYLSIFSIVVRDLFRKWLGDTV